VLFRSKLSKTHLGLLSYPSCLQLESLSDR